MKLSWSNIDDFEISQKSKKFRKKGSSRYNLILNNACLSCDNPFFSFSTSKSLFCDRSCSQKGGFNNTKKKPMDYFWYEDIDDDILWDLQDTVYNFGKSGDYYVKVSHLFDRIDGNYILRRCDYCNKWYFAYKSKFERGEGYAHCTVSCAFKSKKKNYYKNNIPMYDTHQPKLEPYGVECRRSSEDQNILEVKCMYCGRWYQPTRNSVSNKRLSILGKTTGENNFYCSDNCKQACPTFGQIKYPKGFKTNTSREVQPQLRKLVLERDEWVCVKCGSDDKQLHCHHIDPVKNNPIESADVDNCITLCVNCHNEVHNQKGCTYKELIKCLG